MKKIEAPTLADAYEKAALELNCSITELQYEVIQHPTSGVMGLFKKNAIIVADCKRAPTKNENQTADASMKEIIQTIAAEEIIEEVLEVAKPEIPKEPLAKTFKREIVKTEKIVKREEPVVKQYIPKKSISVREKNRLDEAITQQDDVVLDSFFETKETTKETAKETAKLTEERPENNNLELAEKIESELSHLLSCICFEIDTVEVDVVGNTALIFIDGDDAALLIGKEGYRYNALSYMLFNWLHTKYDLYVKLEIAQFLTSQQDMIHNYIKPVIEFVNLNGKGKTRPLDGILVQIALEQLREEFPNKYVAVKTGRDGRKFVIINEFNSRRDA